MALCQGVGLYRLGVEHPRLLLTHVGVVLGCLHVEAKPHWLHVEHGRSSLARVVVAVVQAEVHNLRQNKQNNAIRDVKYWVLLTKCGPHKTYAAGLKTPD